MEEKIMIYTTADEIAAGLQKILDEHTASQPKPPATDPEQRLTRRQAAKFMGVSYQTMYNYVKRGLVKQHGIGQKKWFLKQELIEVIKNENL
ncbi:helix-turn-helix domain-containing protein [Tangfeifania diversioriginum]|nr:helix-turn-helix domain-containing protein [Tangfeifania diversioriginum]